jgi:hypothetical protein
MKDYPRKLFGKNIIGHSLIGILLLLTFTAFNLTQVIASVPAMSSDGICISNLMFGETVHCSIDLAGETDSFTFSGLAGDRIRVRVVKTSGSLSPFREIIRPNGTTLCGTVVTEMTCLLDSSGVQLIAYTCSG